MCSKTLPLPSELQWSVSSIHCWRTHQSILDSTRSYFFLYRVRRYRSHKLIFNIESLDWFATTVNSVKWNMRRFIFSPIFLFILSCSLDLARAREIPRQNDQDVKPVAKDKADIDTLELVQIVNESNYSLSLVCYSYYARILRVTNLIFLSLWLEYYYRHIIY